MSILDVKRTKEDFLKHKSKSSGNTLNLYTFIFKNIEKFCLVDVGLWFIPEYPQFLR